MSAPHPVGYPQGSGGVMAAWILWSSVASGQGLSLTVTGLRPGGTVRAGVYADASAWLSEDRAVAACDAPVRDGRATCELAVPAPGAYAVAFFHDVDGDGTFDTSLGLPREGYGFSRDAPAGLTGPAFGDAALPVGKAVVEVLARIRYVFGK